MKENVDISEGLKENDSSRKRDMNDLPESETPADYHWSFDETDGDSDPDARMYHPLDAINDHLFNETQADVVITPDTEWWPLSKTDRLDTNEMINCLRSVYETTIEDGVIRIAYLSRKESQSEHDEHFSKQNDVGGLQLFPYDESDSFQQYTVSTHNLTSWVKLNSNQDSSEAATSPFTKSPVSAPNISQPAPYLVQAQCQPQQSHAYHGSSVSARESEQGGQMIQKRLRTPEEGDSEHMDMSSSEDEDSKARQELKSKFKREHLEEQTREQKLYQEKLVAQLEALRRQPRSKASAPHILPNANMLSPPQPAMLADGSSLSGLVARLPSVRGERPSVAREEEDVGDGCFKSDMFA
ncbi:hypothetical protein HWV62_9363 [Athelia sp. TMB]|nr:hypothetical protein HWV62_9363 [Athelia sp. TMB]